MDVYIRAATTADLIQLATPVWPGVRRAGLPRLSRAALIIGRRNSAVRAQERKVAGADAVEGCRVVGGVS